MELRTRKPKKGKTQTIPRLRFKGNFAKKRAPYKGSQPKGDVGVKTKGACFNCNEVGHYSKECPKSKAGNGGL
jgi:hypothetical protein